MLKKNINKIYNFAFIEAISKGINWLLLIILPFFIPSDLYGDVVLILAYYSILCVISLSSQDRSCLIGNDKDGIMSYVIATIPILIVISPIVVFVFNGWFQFTLVYFALILNNIYRIINAHFRYHDHLLLFTFSRLTYVTSRLLLTTLLLVKYEITFHFIIAEVISLSLVVFVFWVVRKGIIKQANVRLAIIKKNIRFGYPLIIHSISIIALAQFDRILIGNHFSSSELGVYTFSYTLASSMTFLYSALSVSYEPEIYKSKNLSSAYACSLDYIKISILYGILWGVFVAILSIILNGNFGISVSFEVLFTVILAHLLLPIYLSNNYLLAYVGKTNTIAALSTIVSIISAVALFILVKSLGIFGAALATLLSYITLSLLFYTFRFIAFKRIS